MTDPAAMSTLIPRFWPQFHFPPKRTFKNWLIPGLGLEHEVNLEHLIIPEKQQQPKKNNNNTTIKVISKYLKEPLTRQI